MVRGKANNISFLTVIAPESMSKAEWESAEDMLAELVARAIAAEHPEWFEVNPTTEAGAESE